MLKTSGSTKFTIQPREGIVGISNNSKARRDRNKLDRNEFNKSEINNVEVDGNKINDEIGKKV